MLDVRLFHSLIKAISPRSQIILIGDVDQLPSVGAGNVLRDLINSERIPYTMLKEVFRQASTSKIISTAHEINTGKTPEFNSEEVSDCQFIEVDNPYEIKEVIKDLMNHHLPEKGHYDPVRDIQILTPMNKGELGTETLNQELQEFSILTKKIHKNLKEIRLYLEMVTKSFKVQIIMILTCTMEILELFSTLVFKAENLSFRLVKDWLPMRRKIALI